MPRVRTANNSITGLRDFPGSLVQQHAAEVVSPETNLKFTQEERTRYDEVDEVGLRLRAARATDRRRQNTGQPFRERRPTLKVNAWVREDEPATNAFWNAAYDLARSEFPILEMKRPALIFRWRSSSIARW